MQEARLPVQNPAGASTQVPGRPLARQRTLAWPRRLQRCLMGTGGPPGKLSACTSPLALPVHCKLLPGRQLLLLCGCGQCRCGHHTY